MKILVASAFLSSSRFAHAINTIKIADGFAKLGHNVTLVCRQPESGEVVSAEQLRADFGLNAALDIVQVRSSLLGVRLKPHMHFALQVARLAWRLRPELAYSRSYVAPALLAKLGISSVAESHAHLGYSSRPFRHMVRAAGRSSSFRALVTIAPVLRDNFVELGVPSNKVHVLADAVDLDLFSRPVDYVKEARDRPRIVYAGHLYDYKGIPTILEAAALLPRCDFVLVGGFAADVNRVSDIVTEKRLSNVVLAGLLPLSAVPQHLWGSDVLLLPPSANHPSARWTSPVKLGEYLASGNPVVATRIPALEHWLQNDEVLFVPPDDGEALADAIRRLLDNVDLSASTARRGFSLAAKLSYKERCQKIIDLSGVPSNGKRT